MEVVLLKDLQGIGKTGQTVSVKDGYGRNMLIPRGWAVAATAGAAAQAKAREVVQQRNAQINRQRAEEIASRIEASPCIIAVPVGDQGKLHGAVTSAGIATSLKRLGLEIEKHQILLEKPLAQLGEYAVPVRLHPEVKTTVRVIISKA
jgi:large subunit ribosomal protein L9